MSGSRLLALCFQLFKPGLKRRLLCPGQSSGSQCVPDHDDLPADRILLRGVHLRRDDQAARLAAAPAERHDRRDPGLDAAAELTDQLEAVLVELVEDRCFLYHHWPGRQRRRVGIADLPDRITMLTVGQDRREQLLHVRAVRAARHEILRAVAKTRAETMPIPPESVTWSPGSFW